MIFDSFFILWYMIKTLYFPIQRENLLLDKENFR